MVTTKMPLQSQCKLPKKYCHKEKAFQWYNDSTKPQHKIVLRNKKQVHFKKKQNEYESKTEQLELPVPSRTEKVLPESTVVL